MARRSSLGEKKLAILALFLLRFWILYTSSQIYLLSSYINLARYFSLGYNFYNPFGFKQLRPILQHLSNQQVNLDREKSCTHIRTYVAARINQQSHDRHVHTQNYESWFPHRRLVSRKVQSRPWGRHIKRRTRSSSNERHTEQCTRVGERDTVFLKRWIL